MPPDPSLSKPTEAQFARFRRGISERPRCTPYEGYYRTKSYNSLIYNSAPQARLYVSFTDSDFVRVWSLGEHHETELVMFERNSTLHLSDKLLIGLSPTNLVKIWDKAVMRCRHILDLSAPRIEISIKSTHLLSHSAGHTFTFCNVSRETLESHEIDVGIPKNCTVQGIFTSDTKIVVDVRRSDLSSSFWVSFRD